MTRIPELDGLRGLAAIGVVLFHWFPKYTFWMWSFVDLFLVLSGFLISRIILQGLASGRFSLANFWMRRILRIWPLYFLVLSLVLLLLWWQGRGLQNYAGDILLSAVFMQFVPYYWADPEQHAQVLQFLPGFLHSWSLATEEQFYLVWPLLLIAFYRQWLPRRWLVPGLCLGLLLAYCARYSQSWPPMLLLTRMDGLLLGALLAVCLRGRSGEALRGSALGGVLLGMLALSLAAGVLILWPYFVAGYQGEDVRMQVVTRPELVSGFALSYCALVGGIIYASGCRGLALLGRGLMAYLGRLSYAIYMLHMPILMLIRPALEARMSAWPGYLEVLLIATLIWGLAHLSCVWLEQPLLRLKHHFPVHARRPRQVQERSLVMVSAPPA